MSKLVFLTFLLTASAPVFGQTITISNMTFSGTAGQNDYTNPITGTGQASVTGGSASVALSGYSTRDRGLACSDVVQLSVKFSFNSTDSITTIFTAPTTPNLTTFTFTEPINVISGTGQYAGKGGSGNITISVVTNSDGTFNGTGSGTLQISSQLTPFPYIYPSGVVANDNIVPIVQPGGWVAIYGANLANGVTNWNNNFPANLGGVSVTINNKSAYMYYVSPTQINVQAPSESTSGCDPVVVNTPNGQVTTAVTLEPQSPTFATLVGPANTYAISIGINSDGTYNVIAPTGAFSGLATRPAKAGEVLEFWGFGMGPTNPAVPAGSFFAQPAPLANPNSFTVTIGGKNASVLGVALVYPGEYQINVQIPTGLPSGDNLIQGSLFFANPVLGTNTQTQSNLYITVQ
jgi:uncharacterized protein (TIGR03437 family)